MTYATDNLITAADFNAFQATMQKIIGTGTGDYGYGQSLTIPPVIVGQTIAGDEWQKLWDAYRLTYYHQNGAEPGEPIKSRFFTDAMVIAHALGSTGPGDIKGAITTLETNRLETYSHVQTYIDKVSERGSPWSDAISATARFTWASENEARYFFNQGGNVHVALDQQIVASPQDQSWRDAVLSGPETGHNSIIVSAMWNMNTYNDDTTHYSNGYYQVPVGSTVKLFDVSASGLYSDNYHKVMLYNGGSYLEFTAILEDNHTSLYTEGDMVSEGMIMHAAYQVPATPGLTVYPPSVTCTKQF